MDRGQRIQSEANPNLFVGRRVAVLSHEAGDEIINFALPTGDRHAAIVGEKKANVKEKRSSRIRAPILPNMSGRLRAKILRNFFHDPIDLDCRILGALGNARPRDHYI